MPNSLVAGQPSRGVPGRTQAHLGHRERCDDQGVERSDEPNQDECHSGIRYRFDAVPNGPVSNLFEICRLENCRNLFSINQF